MSIEFIAKVNEDGTILLPEEYRHLQSHRVKVQLTEQDSEEDAQIFSWRERVVLDEIIGNGVRALISKDDKDTEREE